MPNIYVTDTDPFLAATNLDDRLVLEAFMDSCLLLSTVGQREGVAGDDWPNPISFEHPLVRWLRNDKANLMWLIAHAYGLLAEYEERFDMSHAGDGLISDITGKFGYERKAPIMFCNRTCGFEHVQDVTIAYRLYLDQIWVNGKQLPKWTNKKPPSWYCEDLP